MVNPKDYAWRDKAAWNDIPEYHRDRVQSQFEKDWDITNHENHELVGSYVQNWLANNEDKNIDKAGDIIDKEKSLQTDDANMKRIHEQLKKAKFLKGKALDYDTFVQHAVNNPEYRMKIHGVLRQNGMESNDIDFNTFNTLTFGDEVGEPRETSVDVEGVPFDITRQLNTNEKAQQGNEYKNKLVAQQEAYNEIFKGGADAIPLKPDGTIDYDALNKKLREIKSYAPNTRIAKVNPVIEEFDFDVDLNLDEKNIMVPDLSGEDRVGGDWDNSTNRAITALQPYVKAGFSFEESTDPDDYSNQTESLLITAPNGEELNIQPTSSNQQTILDFLKNNNQLISAEDQRANETKLQEYYNGEIDLSSAELAKISTIDPEVKDYVLSMMPEDSKIPNKDDFMGTVNPETQKKYTSDEAEDAEFNAFQEAYQSTFNDAVHQDPRYEFATTQAREATDKLSKDYIEKLREKYVDEDGLVSEENMPLMQEEFADWYNNTTQENLKNNKVAKRLFQDYGLASAELYGDRFRSFEKYNYDTWLDDNVYREIDQALDSGRGGPVIEFMETVIPTGGWWNRAWQKVRSSSASIPSGVRTVSNTIEIALQKELEMEGRSEIYNSIKDGIENGDLTEDMTLAEAREVNGEIDSWMKWNLLHGWSEDDSLKDFYAKRKERYDNTVRDLTEDLGDLSQQERYGGFAADYADMELDGYAIPDWFVNSSADMIKQAPHMVPSTLGGILIAAGTATTAMSGGTLSFAGVPAATLGSGLLAVGSGVMASQVYADVYMQGLRRQMEGEYGEGGFSTEDYLDALSKDEYGSQMPALTAAALTGASEYLFGKLGGNITGNIAGNILKSTAGNKILGATFANYARGLVSYGAATTVDGVIEGATEGFQSYMAQVAENAMNLYKGDMENEATSSIFYKNIDVDEIIEEAKMGFNMGIFMGVGGVALSNKSNKGGNYDNLNYEGRAMQIAEKYDISGFNNDDGGIGPGKSGPGGSGAGISVAANKAFLDIQQAIKTNNNLTPVQKRNKIQTVSDIREAAIKVPPTVRGADKKALIDLLREKKSTTNQIKKINDKTISGAQGLDSRLSEINTEISDVIKNNINNKPITRNTLIPPKVMDAIFNNVSRFAGVQNFVDPRDRALNRDFSIADDGISPAQQGPKLNEGVQDFTQDQITRTNRPQTVEGEIIQAEAAGGSPTPVAAEVIQSDLIQEGRDKTPDVRNIVAENDSYSRTDRLMNDADFDLDNRFDQRRALKAAAPVIEAALKREYKPGSLLTRDQFRTALENEYLLTLREYNEDQDVNLQGPGKQTSNLFGLRAKRITRENIGKGERASLDREDAMQLADTSQEQDLDQDQTVGTREKVYSSETDQVQDQDVSETKANIEDQVAKDILLAVNKGDNPATTVSRIKNNITKDYFKELRRDIGTFASKTYKDFINSLDEAFIKSIPAATIKRRFGKLFGIKKIGTTPTKQVSKTGNPSNFNKPVYSIPKITKEGLQEFKDYFLADEKRQQSIYRVLSTDFALESINELMADDTENGFMEKLETALGDSGITAVEFMQTLENLLDARVKEDASLDVVDAPVAKAPLKKEADKKKAREKAARERLQQKQFDDTWTKGVKEGVNNLINILDSDYLSDTKADKAKKQKRLFEALAKLGIDPRKFVTASNLAGAGYQKSRIDKRGQGVINYVDNINKLAGQKKKDADKQAAKELPNRDAEYDATQTAYNKGEIVSIADILPELIKIYRESGFTPDDGVNIKAAIAGQSAKKAADANRVFDRNVKDVSKIEDGIKEIFDIFRKIEKSLQAPLLNIYYGYSNFTNNIGRQLAPLLGKMKNFIKGLKIINEHVLQHGVTTRLIGDMMNMSKAKADVMQNYLEDNMLMVALQSRNDAQEKTYGPGLDPLNYGTPGIGIYGDKLSKWKSQDQAHPFFMEQYDKWRKGEISDADFLKISPLLRYFNEYFYLNGNAIEMYNRNNGKIESMFKVLNSDIRSDVDIDGKIYTSSDLMGVSEQNGVAFYPNVVKEQAFTAMKVAKGEWDAKQAQAYLKTAVKPALMADLANLKSQEYMPQLLQKLCGSPCRVPRTSKQVKQTMLNSLAARIKALNPFKKPKGLSAFDMDDTLALTKEKVIYTLNDKTAELTAGEFAVQYEGLLEQGAEFDFTNFDNVDLSTPKGPLAGTALRRQDKYGSKDIYIVTARPNASKNAIKVWTDSIGLNIPIENIITLEDGSPQAKSDWLLSKAAEGYNDFYFADDSLLNVQTVKDILGQIDVKSRVQQAIDDKAIRLDQEMNDLIEDATDIGAERLVSEVEARIEGKKRDKGFFKRVLRQFKITASADDFLGLGYYLFGKGEKGTRQRKWFVENLIAPYDKAEQALISAKATVANDFAALKKAFPSLRSKGLKGIFNNPLTDQVGYKSFTKSQAARVYLWNKQGMEIPGMSQTDIDGLVNAVNTDFELQQFADKIQLIQKESQYPAPGANWLAGDIKSDILNGLDKTFRAELLSEWSSNIDIVFSEKNLNKLEKAFGSKYREALEDSIKRMRSGTNRPTYTGSGSRQVNEMMDWLNSSVGVAMFLNMRSGSLQMLSNVNFINWGDNNIYAAAKAFASKDYVPTVMKLMNSDYLVNRRDGLKINVNEAELAAAANKGGFKGMLNFLLDKGFILTRIFDSLAIATGGAPFYINRTKSLLKRVNPKTGKLYTQKEAEVKAFDDFYSIAEETQQSSNPSKISSQQASLFGRTILSYQNVTMQYNRKAKKMLLDFINRRRRPGMTQRESDLSNLSGVMYYVAIQNLIFNSLQQALFAVMFDDEPDEKEKNRIGNTINGMLDSLLFGLGFGGALISTVKNVARELKFQYDRKTPKYEEAVFNLFDISPVLDQKIRNIRTGLRTFSWNMKEIKNRGWSLENPAYLAVSQLISAFTNVPLDRLLRKYNNVSQAFDEETRTYEKIALLLGWNGWNFGLPYWGRESTIKQELQDEETLRNNFKADVRKAKKDGFTKRVPFTGPNSGKPKGVLGVDYVQIERYDGLIQYYKKP